MATIFSTNTDKQFIQQLLSGAVGVLPTDTLYGVVCQASNKAAVERLYQLKNRERKPGTVIASSTKQLITLGFKGRYLKAVEQYWPGSISVVIPCVDLDWLHMGIGSVAVRIVNDAEVAHLLDTVGPLLTSSANLPGQPPANTIDQAVAYFGDRVDFYVDGGDLTGRLGSTIIRVVDDAVEVLRPGAVKIDEETGKIL